MKQIIMTLGILCGLLVEAPAQVTLNKTGPRLKDGPHYAHTSGGDVRDEQAGFGWQVAYAFQDWLSMEASITRQTDKLDDLGAIEPPFLDEFDLQIYALAVSGRLNQRWKRLNVYAGGGLGYYFMKTDSGDARRSVAQNPGALPPGVTGLNVGVDLDNTFAYHAAIGFEVLLTEKWEMFAEYRRVYLDTDLTIRRTETRSGRGPGALEFRQDTTETQTAFDYEHGLIRVGVNYRF